MFSFNSKLKQTLVTVCFKMFSFITKTVHIVLYTCIVHLLENTFVSFCCNTANKIRKVLTFAQKLIKNGVVYMKKIGNKKEKNKMYIT